MTTTRQDKGYKSYLRVFNLYPMKTVVQDKGYRSCLGSIDLSNMNTKRSDKGSMSYLRVFCISLFVSLHVMSNLVFNVFGMDEYDKTNQPDSQELLQMNNNLEYINSLANQNITPPHKTKSLNTGGGLGIYFNLSKTNSIRVGLGLEALVQYNWKSIPNSKLDVTSITTLDKHLLLCGVYLPVLRFDIGKYFYISGPLIGFRMNIYSVSEETQKRNRITFGVTVGTELGLNIHKYLSLGLRVEWDPYNSRIKYNQIAYGNSKPFTVSLCLRLKMPTEKLSVHVICQPIGITCSSVKSGYDEGIKDEINNLQEKIKALNEQLKKNPRNVRE